MNILESLQTWYKAQCDGDWEHQNGLSIESLDNPGWLLTIDLKGTSLEGKLFEEIHIERNKDDWIDDFRC